MKSTTTVIAALTALMLAGCSSPTGSTAAHGTSASPGSPTSTTAALPAAHGVEAAIGSVPWSQVGPGWMLATHGAGRLGELDRPVWDDMPEPASTA